MIYNISQFRPKTRTFDWYNCIIVRIGNSSDRWWYIYLKISKPILVHKSHKFSGAVFPRFAMIYFIGGLKRKRRVPAMTKIPIVMIKSSQNIRITLRMGLEVFAWWWKGSPYFKLPDLSSDETWQATWIKWREVTKGGVRRYITKDVVTPHKPRPELARFQRVWIKLKSTYCIYFLLLKVCMRSKTTPYTGKLCHSGYLWHVAPHGHSGICHRGERRMSRPLYTVANKSQ